MNCQTYLVNQLILHYYPQLEHCQNVNVLEIKLKKIKNPNLNAD